MPRSTQQILDQAAELASRFEAYEPDAGDFKDGAALRALRQAVLARANAERDVADTVAEAREEGHAWDAIGAMLGTSGEAARQRYSSHRRRAA